MERGTDREIEAVEAEWARREARRTAATRLLGGLVAAGVGWVLVLLATATEVCLPRAKGATLWCRAAAPTGSESILLGLGLLSLCVSAVVLWSVFRPGRPS